MRNNIKNLIKVTLIATSLIILSTATTFAQSNTPDEFQKEVQTHIQNRETSFTINYTGASIVFQIPDLVKKAFNSDDYLKFCLVQDKGRILSATNGIDVDLFMTYTSTKEQEDYVDQQVDYIVSKVVTLNMTDMQKARALYDYVYNATSLDSNLTNITAYNALFDGTATDKGYAMLLYKLYTKVGIPCKISNGNIGSNNYTWNMAELNGKWYNVDASNDSRTDLPKDNNTSTELKAITQAYATVISAEIRKTQNSVDNANILISLLPYGSNQYNLQKRINDIQISDGY